MSIHIAYVLRKSKQHTLHTRRVRKRLAKSRARRHHRGLYYSSDHIVAHHSRRRRAHLVKGSEAAKRYMAKLRHMRKR